jgi:hypothetical protein
MGIINFLSWQIKNLCYNGGLEINQSHPLSNHQEFHVSTNSKSENLAKIKIMLAEKYERLAKLTPSVPKRATFLRHAKSYRRQAELLAR